MNTKFRCDCPITSAIDILGDRWLLVIIKQMLIQGKQTFKDFIESDEAIASNVLAVKLKLLEELGMVSKSKLPTNNKNIYYHLTDKGLSLTPIIVELAIWSDENLRELNVDMQKPNELLLMKSHKEDFIDSLKENYKEKIVKTPHN